jgi:hypothetical protein
MMASFLLLDALCALNPFKDGMLGNNKKNVPKCDSLEKHVKKKRNEYGQKVMDMKHVFVID